MTEFVVTGPDGKKYRVTGDSAEGAAQAVAEMLGGQRPQPNPDGTYGQPPAGMFVNPNTGQMTSRELLKGNESTGPARAAGMGYVQGFAYNAADEAIGAAGQALGGDVQGTFQREAFRARDEALREANPGAYLVGQIPGYVTSPVTKAFPRVSTVRGAAATGAGMAAIDAVGRGEGDILTRATGAVDDAVWGGIFGGLTASAVNLGRTGLRRVFERAEKRPTIESLRTAKNAAYGAVRQSGVEFTADDTLALWNRMDDLARDPRWDLDPIAEVDRPALDALRVLQRRAEAGRVTLDNLDKTRQKLWDSYNRTGHPYILESIGAIDDTIAQKAAGNELMEAARKANSLYAKSQLLDTAFRKARLQTAATGSGGNILNKYRQAVASILNKPHEAKWFTPDEIAKMESFVYGEMPENVLRRIGKMAPTGNGLMTALNVYAASVDPTMLAVTGLATAAKESADTSAMRGAEELLDGVARGTFPAAPTRQNFTPYVAGGAVAVPNALRGDER